MNKILSRVLKRLSCVAVFGAIYLACFFFVEQRRGRIHIIYTKLDDLIPFCEYFIIPYLLWFLFVAATVIYFAIFNEEDREYYSLIGSLGIGMAIFLIISFVYPNGQNLRPELTGDSIFIEMVRALYQNDTSTNILPSLHVYNAVACGIALYRNQKFAAHRVLNISMLVLVVLIILSTMFLKQHSIIDVIAALIINVLCYQLFYAREGVPNRKRHRYYEKVKI